MPAIAVSRLRWKEARAAEQDIYQTRERKAADDDRQQRANGLKPTLLLPYASAQAGKRDEEAAYYSQNQTGLAKCL